ncbi:Collagenase ColH [Thermoflexales bacterium]|nr:Collagenase ColH [Thermoflexales bacterium]
MPVSRVVKISLLFLALVGFAGVIYLFIALPPIGSAAPAREPAFWSDLSALEHRVLAAPVTSTLALVAPTEPQPVTTTLDVAVVITDAGNLAAFELDVIYDRTRLEVTGMTLSNLLGDPAAGCDPAVSRCAVALGPLDQPNGSSLGAYSFGAGTAFSGTGTLAVLHFRPLGLPGTVALDIANALLIDADVNIAVPETQGATLILIRRTPFAAFLAGKGLNVAQLEDGAGISEASSVRTPVTSYRPENAIDNSTSTFWSTASGQTANQWIKVQLFQGETHVVDRVVLRGTTGNLGLRDFEIRVSNTLTEDGAFTTVFTGTVPADSLSHEYTFEPVQAKYVQLYVVNNWGNISYTYVYHFQVWTRDRQGGIVSLREGPPARIAGFSSMTAGLPPENAIDESTGTYWRPANGQLTNQWLNVELGGQRTYLIDRVRLQSRTSSVAVRDFEIRVSTTVTDDAAFTTVFTGTATNDATLQEFALTPVEARYVQLFIRNNHGSTCCTDVVTFQVLATDGANLARREGVGAFIVGFSSQASTSSSPDKAIDFDPNSLWQTASGQNTNQWFKVRLLNGEAHRIDRVRLRGYASNLSPRNFQIRVSNATPADADFTLVYSGTLPNDSQSHWVKFLPISAKYVQFYVLDNYGATTVGVYDFQVYSLERGGAVVPFDSFSSDFDGQVTSWNWDFGDATSSTAQHPLHTFATPGTYSVTLTVTDNDGFTDTTASVYTVLPAPRANFTWSPLVPNEGQSVSLTDASQDDNGPLVGWLWQFAHTTSQPTTQNTSTSFPDNSTYPVTLTVTNNQLLTAMVTRPITTNNAPPTVFAGSDRTILVDQNWNVNATVSDPGTADTSTLTCQWDYGDGQTALINNCNNTSVRAVHIYSQTGVYTATLTVTDKDGASTSDSLVSTVVKRNSFLIIFGVQSLSPGQAQVTAGLYDVTNWDTPMTGRVISFTWDSQVVTATTDADGIATTLAPLSAGQEVTLTASFAGDRNYNPSSDTNVLKVAPTLPQGDIVFIIDESGSMGDDQAAVRARLNDIADQLGFAVDFRLGLVGFGSGLSLPYAGAPRIVISMTDNLAAFSTALGTLRIDGGFEPGFAATTVAMSDTMNYRQGAGVCAILISDEDADQSAQAVETRADALAALNLRNATFLGIVSLNFGTTRDDYGPNPGSLSEATGGAVFEILEFEANPGPALAAIVDECAQAIIQNVPPDLEMTKTDERTAAGAGEMLTYTLTITNSSVQDATGVAVTDTLPLHTAFSAASDGGSESGGVVTWPVFDVPFASTVTRTVTVQLAGALPAGVEEVTNVAIVQDDGANGIDPTPANNIASDTTLVEAAPDLVVVKSDADLLAVAGGLVTYTVTFSNTGTQTASGVVLTETVPAVTAFNAVASSAGWSCPDGSLAGTECAFSVGELIVGGSGTLEFVVTVSDTLPANGLTITNTVVIGDDGANGADLNPVDNIAVETTTLAPLNLDPIAVADTSTTTVGVPVTINVLANDSDPDGDPLSVIAITPPLSGTAAINLDNTITYTPTSGFAGIDAFTYTISDGRGGTDTAVVTVGISPALTCNLYPIGLHTKTLAGVPVGSIVTDILNGTRQGNFGWLTWTGAQGVPTLVQSLTPPGDSHTYINPYDPTDHVVSIGDWVRSRPGVANSQSVREALDVLKTIDIIVPVWDKVKSHHPCHRGNSRLGGEYLEEGCGDTKDSLDDLAMSTDCGDCQGGTKVKYHIVNFAQVRLISYHLPGQDRISARFLGYAICGTD